MCFQATIRDSGNQAELLRTLQAQGVEISRATAPFTVELKTKKAGSEARTPAAGNVHRAARSLAIANAGDDANVPGRQLHRPHGPTLQPHRRRLARLSVLGAKRSANGNLRRHCLDHGRTGERRSRARHDATVLDAPMERVTGDVRAPGGDQRTRAPSISSITTLITISSRCVIV